MRNGSENGSIWERAGELFIPHGAKPKEELYVINAQEGFVIFDAASRLLLRSPYQERGHSAIEISHLDTEFLRVLGNSVGMPLSNMQLLEAVHGTRTFTRTYVRDRLRLLNKKLGIRASETNQSGVLIHNKRGVGYYFKEPARRR